jgi:hypothetical protein
VTTALTTLGANNVGAEFEALLDVLGVSDHVHVENAGLMELLDDVLWWDTDGTDKEFCSALDDDINKLVELSFGVVVAKCKLAIRASNLHVIDTKNILGLSCITANLRQKQVNAEWRILIVEVSL